MRNTTENTDDPVLLMCAPDFYEIRKPDKDLGAANDFEVEGYKVYAKNPKMFRKESDKQWKSLRAIFNALGVQIVEMEPQKNHPDMVFTADPGFSIGNTPVSDITILSHFTNTERQKEVDHMAQAIEHLYPNRTLIRAYYQTEGAGDNIYDPYRDVIWSGFCSLTRRSNAAAGRSDLRAHRVLSAVTGTEVVSLHVQRPFFHLDTSFAPLSKGHILCAADGLQPFAYERMLTRAFNPYGMDPKEYLIPVHGQDAARYACNIRCIGDTVIMPEVSEDLKRRVKDKGYNVITTDLRQFIYAGGAVHCLTNNLNEKRVIGGITTVERPALKSAM